MAESVHSLQLLVSCLGSAKAAIERSSALRAKEKEGRAVADALWLVRGQLAKIFASMARFCWKVLARWPQDVGA